MIIDGDHARLAVPGRRNSAGLSNVDSGVYSPDARAAAVTTSLNVEPGVAVLPEERTGIHGSIPTAAGLGATIAAGAAAAGHAAKEKFDTLTGHPAATLQEVADSAKRE